ncbi:N-acetylmuramoyl-L-alanine amidase [Paenibacillus alkaliterrae]|uniref:peptidoglycan recognition protein family protein n=1 Tax=Paenibacillus alkaliterrae TaxID=320909 RepID=UPI001F2757C4|nr:N-acetylmuramoyl-L-alanine amidase [Paenibacillus alkaliterrae]MCF2939055.1 N-acetylmuramoyl-L-alanine amidase [Paenibacillus alkaliterrae]
MVKYIVDHIPGNTPLHRRPEYKMAPTSITIHNTGNMKSTARNERAYLTNPSNNRTASYHIVIDEHEAIECIPLNESTWHAGDGGAADSGNRTSIGIEICESGNYARTLDNTAELVASMLKERGWGVDRLRRHYDWSRKICPRLMYDNGSWAGWAVFKNTVAAKLKPKEVEHEMTKEDADKIIEFLKAGYAISAEPASRNEFNRLANELRKVSGQKEQ